MYGREYDVKSSRDGVVGSNAVIRGRRLQT